MEMHDNDYMSYLIGYRNKLSKLLDLFNNDNVKYESKILQTEAMIRVVDHLKSEYMKVIYSNLQETNTFPTVGNGWNCKNFG
jgi:hypothetical protein